MKKTKNVTKNTKHNSRKSNLFNKKIISLVSIAIIALVGSFIITSSFAESKNGDLSLKTPVEETVVSLKNEKPVSAYKDQDGHIKYTSRGKSIDVTVSGTVYCTPEDDGDVKVATITAQKLNQTLGEAKKVSKAKNKSELNDQENIADEVKQLQVDGEATVSTKAKQQAVLPDGLSKTDQILNDLCKTATTIVPPEQVPTFVPKNKRVMRKRHTYTGNVISAITPKASASGVTVTDSDIRPDVEQRQVDLINANRKNLKLKPLGKSNCLTNSARSWVKQMVAVGNIYHSNMIGPIESACGANWWKSVAENVGLDGTLNADHTFQLYWNSPGHKTNIVNPNFQRVGVGAAVAYKPSSGVVVLWTAQHFVQCQGACKEK